MQECRLKMLLKPAEPEDGIYGNPCLCEEENIRKTEEYNVLKEAIEMYDSTTTKVVFIPALDDSKEFYMNRTNIGLDYLSEKADAAK